MKRLFRILILPALAALVNLGVSSAQECQTLIIKNAQQVRSAEVQFYMLEGENVVPTGEPKAKEALSYPLSLEDCGLAQYYVLRTADAMYLVDKAKFRCVEIAVSDRSGTVAAAPGSGISNESCK